MTAEITENLEISSFLRISWNFLRVSFFLANEIYTHKDREKCKQSRFVGQITADAAEWNTYLPRIFAPFYISRN